MTDLNVEALTLGDLDTNCYLVSCPVTAEVLIIDPADDGGYITDVILQRQLQPTGILLTHGHFDHVLGLLELKLNFPVPVMLHAADDALLQRATESAKHWLKRVVDPVPPADQAIKDGDVIMIGKSWLKIIETPGHTPGSIAAFNDSLLFTGDTLFKEGVGRTDFSYSNSKKLWQSVAKLRELSNSRRCWAGHGEGWG